MNNQYIKQLVNKAETEKYSGIIYVENNGNKVLEYIAGMENRELKKPITHNTIFAVASGTKFLTALAIGKLIDQRKITLETKAKSIYNLGIDTYHPDIKIKHLLAHTSGMPDYFDEDKVKDLDQVTFEIPNSQLLYPKDFMPMFPKEAQAFEPGAKFKYNNQAYVYLAIIIEEVTDKPYHEFINEDVLKPLGIINSGVHHFESCPLHTAIGYLGIEDDALTNDNKVPYLSGGDGGAYFSVDDMKLLWEAFFSYHIISKDLVDQFITPQINVDESKDTYYGLGLWLKKENDFIFPYLLGGDPGISFVTSYYRTHKDYRFAASNTSNGVWGIFDILKKI